ncbi:DUF2946 domain-containing protein [Nitrobacter vulgaris]|jgi:hypothetical protein|uniref:DUF2946 domain-containing protein n=1 Tax=Nitrobacter vulgaris TaxID=29421 RepID=A0A1V4HWB8_NITVU|nr:DUF2946 domain-containing protein [Nitrobacter vulgaris]OPH82271.1 DUF2946 domain-containing protein [Nitrobacter vulgaris]
MKWFRSNIKHGSRLALFALAIQFVLSFGHHHGAAALEAPTSVQTNASVPASDPAAARTGATVDPQHAVLTNSAKTFVTSPAGPTGDDQERDRCAVCAVMALAGTMLFTGPPVLLLPDACNFLHLVIEAEFNHLESRPIAFQPRAPPSS